MKLPFENTHFIWLTVALIALLVLGALSRAIPDNITLQVIEVSTIGLLLLSLMSLKTDKKLIKWFVLILGLMAVAVLVEGFFDHTYAGFGFLSAMLVFYLLAAWLVGSQVLLTGSVDLNKIVGSVALYLLIGLIYGILYTMLLEVSPDSLRGIEVRNWYDNWPEATYFSFVTLTTLGYGDISPVTPLAQVLAMLEAITGVFYLAIIVAGLIGARLKT